MWGKQTGLKGLKVLNLKMEEKPTFGKGRTRNVHILEKEQSPTNQGVLSALQGPSCLVPLTRREAEGSTDRLPDAGTGLGTTGLPRSPLPDHPRLIQPHLVKTAIKDVLRSSQQVPWCFIFKCALNQALLIPLLAYLHPASPKLEPQR